MRLSVGQQYPPGGKSAERQPTKWRHVAPAYLVGSAPWLLGQLLRLLTPDLVRAVVPIVVVFLILLLFTGDLILALSGLVLLAFSLGIALFLYRLLLGATWLSVYSFPCLYIVIGVGADDIFIAMQAWAQSGRSDAYVEERRDRLAGGLGGGGSEGDVAARLSFVFRVAGEAMLTTTLTSVAAFLATMALTPIASIRSFGFLTAAALLFAYVLVLTFFSACLAARYRPRGSRQPSRQPSRQNSRQPSRHRVRDFADVASTSASVVDQLATNRASIG